MAEKTKTTEEPDFRPLISPESKIKPLKQLFAGFEIEKRQVLLTVEEDHTKGKNALQLYNEVLAEGVSIDQGYIINIQEAAKVLGELGVKLNEFKPNTIRLRKFGPGYKKKKISPAQYVLTLKDRKETKKREVEFKLTRAQFGKYWEMTVGARVYKKRLKKKFKGQEFEIDGFIDRILMIAEQEVTKEEDLKSVVKLGMDVTGNKSWTNKTLAK